MVRLVGSPSWRAGAGRALAAVLAAAVALAAPGCSTITVGVSKSLDPEPGPAAIVVRVFDSSSDLKAGRLSQRAITSTLTSADGDSYEAFGPEWFVGDVEPGAYRLMVRYGGRPGSPAGAAREATLSLGAGETVSVDVVTRAPSSAVVGLLTAVIVAAAVVGMTSVGQTSSESSARTREDVPRGRAATRVPRAPEPDRREGSR